MALRGRLSRNLLLSIVTVVGSGLISKKMPGTLGSLFSTLTVLFLIPRSASILFFLTFVTFIVGWLCCKLYIPRYESCRDPGYIVIDEACGILLGAALLCSFGISSNFVVLINFVLFRLFDIWKPFPIGLIERKLRDNERTVSLGIMLDDILAALFCTVIQILLFRLFCF